MFGLAAILEALVGPLFRWVTIPVFMLTFTTITHLWWEGHKERLRLEGERRCDVKWEQEIREEERKNAESQVAGARQLLEAERKTSEVLNAELDKIKSQMGRVRASVRSGNGDGCLSDGVLNELRGRKDSSGPVKPGAKKSGSSGPAFPFGSLLAP